MNRLVRLKELELPGSVMTALPTSADLLFKRFCLRHRATYLHSLRVVELCRKLAGAFGLSPSDESRLLVSAALHEVGMMETTVEYEIPLASMRIVEQWGLAEAADKDAIVQQAENMDGTGFPAGLMWRDISLSAKIIRVADSFDRMTISPLGGQLLAPSAALDELYRWSDVQYDSHVVNALKHVHRKARVHTYMR